MYMITLVGFQGGNTYQFELGWATAETGGATTTGCTRISNKYAIAFEAPSVYISRNPVIAFEATNGVEEFDVVCRPTNF